MTKLAPRTRAWIETETGTPVRSAIVLDGTTATVHRVDLSDGRSVVAKRFDRPDILDERPERADHEAAVLDRLSGTRVPAPRLIAVDGDGSRAGAPTVLMSWVEGATALPDGWVEGMAVNLADIHAVQPGPIIWSYHRYNEGFELAPPRWAKGPRGVGRRLCHRRRDAARNRHRLHPSRLSRRQPAGARRQTGCRA